jgi:hypothetical protein
VRVMALEEHDQDAGLQSFQDLSDLPSDRDFRRNPI